MLCSSERSLSGVCALFEDNRPIWPEGAREKNRHTARGRQILEQSGVHTENTGKEKVLCHEQKNTVVPNDKTTLSKNTTKQKQYI